MAAYRVWREVEAPYWWAARCNLCPRKPIVTAPTWQRVGAIVVNHHNLIHNDYIQSVLPPR